MRKLTAGRVSVKQMKPKTEIDGMALPDEEKVNWGTVVQVGPPLRHQYTKWEMFLWQSFGVHPFKPKVGDKVLLPSLSGRVADDIYIYWQHDIEVYEDPKK
jgi:hypothetical protein